jgi:hypothetical protein
MSRHMASIVIGTPKLRTSLRLNASILEVSKAEAAKRGMTLTEFMERGLYLAIKESQQPKKHEPIKLPVCTSGGGLLVPIDFNNSAEMWDIIEELERQEKLERQTRDDSAGR